MTTNSKAHMPAAPLNDEQIDMDQRGYGYSGLSKREYACIHCGVPATGDPDLDAIIAEGNRIQKAMIDAPAFQYRSDGQIDLSRINVE